MVGGEQRPDSLIRCGWGRSASWQSWENALTTLQAYSCMESLPSSARAGAFVVDPSAAHIDGVDGCAQAHQVLIEARALPQAALNIANVGDLRA